MKVVACIIARTVSTRLPLKVLRNISDQISILDFLIMRLKLVNSIDEIYLCTSKEEVDDILEDVAIKHNIKIYRGSADNVIERMLDVGEIAKADFLLRITGDNPLTSYEWVDKQYEFIVDKELDYVRLIDVPIGATAEIMTFSALKKCYQSINPGVSEYLMLFLFEPRSFKCGVIKPFEEDYSYISITVDLKKDLVRTKSILSHFKEPLSVSLEQIIGTIKANNIPDAFFKATGEIKMPYGKSISFDDFREDMKRRVDNSAKLSLYE
ncbi:MAG: hypothetical protein AAF363_14220 [Bacteroidota bacterium]